MATLPAPMVIDAVAIAMIRRLTIPARAAKYVESHKMLNFAYQRQN